MLHQLYPGWNPLSGAAPTRAGGSTDDGSGAEKRGEWKTDSLMR